MNKLLLLICMYISAAFVVFGQQDIASARVRAEGSKVTVSGTATNGSELGVVRFIQDQSGGIAVYSSKM